MNLLDKIGYQLIMLQSGSSDSDGFDEDTLKKAGWQVTEKILGWVLAAGAMASLVMAVWFFLEWMHTGFETGTAKKKFFGTALAVVFCTFIGVSFLTGLFDK